MAQEREGNQRSWVGWLQIAAIFAIVVTAIFITLSLSRNDASNGGYSSNTELQAVPVRTMMPQPVSYRVEIETTGTATARALVSLTAQVGGRVVDVSRSVRGGGTFQPGEVLFTIDPSDYEIAVIRAESALAEARSVYARTEADAELARREWQETYPDQDITPLAAREPQLEAARAQLLSAQAQLAQAGLNLERTQVSFPYAGRIVESRIEEGLLLIAGQSYGTAYNSAEIEIIAPVSADELVRLGDPVGMPVDIVFENGTRLSGEVVREGADLDSRSRLVDLYIEADDSSSLRPGLFGEISIHGEETGNVYQLPDGAVSGLNTVHIVRDGMIERLEVDIVDRTLEGIIVSPFDAGEGLIISPLPSDVEGREVDMAQEDVSSAAATSGDPSG